ncbi:hypothetical protein [Bounagaea algeriensis]
MSERNGLSDEHIAAALRGYAAGGSAADGSAAGGSGGSPAAGTAEGARVRPERPRPSAAGVLLYALLLGLAAGTCCAAVTLL